MKLDYKLTIRGALIIKLKNLPFRWAVILIFVFQAYLIYRDWEKGFLENLISIFILVGCIGLLVWDIVFKEDK